jgi:hypothetical protein
MIAGLAVAKFVAHKRALAEAARIARSRYVDVYGVMARTQSAMILPMPEIPELEDS